MRNSFYIWLLIFVVLFAFAGCGNKQVDAQLMDLRGQISELNRQVTDAHVRIEELNNRVFLLQEQQIHGQMERTPADIKVVKLVPQKPKKAPVKHYGEVKVSGASSSEPILISNWDYEPLPKKAASSRSKKISNKKTSNKKTSNVEKDYQVAIALFNEKKYSKAIDAFASLLQKYGVKNSYADNAVFWSGVCFFEQGEFDLAISEFEKVLSFTQTNKAADTLHYLGLCYNKKNNTLKAAEFWKKTIEAFPDSEAAKKSKSMLKLAN